MNSYLVRCCCRHCAMCVHRWMVPVCLQNAWTLCHHDLCSRMSNERKNKTERSIKLASYYLLKTVMQRDTKLHSKYNQHCQLSDQSHSVCVRAWVRERARENQFYEMQIIRAWWRERPRRIASKHVVLVPSFLKHAIHGCLHLAQNTNRWKHKTATT